MSEELLLSYFVTSLPQVRSKSNYRSTRAKSGAWREFAEFEKHASLLLRQSMPNDWVLGDAQDTILYRPQVISCVLASTMLDAGNISKSVLDAAESVVYHNDASVRAVTQLIRRSSKGQSGAVGFAMISREITDEQVLQALCELSLRTLEHWNSTLL